ncbi:MAG: hypothetical protein STSR0008_12120 [Ignavibacterium sp.]
MLLNEISFKAVFFGKGFEEIEFLYEIKKNLGDNCFVVSNKNLDEVASYISCCDLFIGNDSGLMNISVGLRIGMIAIIGPTNPKHKGPFGDKNHVNFLDIECTLCFDSGYSMKCIHHNCINQLEPPFVFEKMRKIINSKIC